LNSTTYGMSASPTGAASYAEPAVTYRDWHDIPKRIVAASPHYQRYIIRCIDAIKSWCKDVVTLLGDAAHPMVP